MGEVVDLTFTDSDAETEPGPSRNYEPHETAPAPGGMRTPLRRLLALRNGGEPAEAPLPSQPKSQPCPVSPETIELLSPDPPQREARIPPEPANSGPSHRLPQRRQQAAPASRPKTVEERRSLEGVSYNEYDYGGTGAGYQEDEPWQPPAAPPPAALPAAGRKPKRTREEIAIEAALKKQRKAAETAARKQAQHYNSDKHVLRYVTVLVDPEMMGCPLGPKILLAFQETQAQQAEHEHIHYKVASTGLSGVRAIKWVRKVPSGASQSQQMPALVPESQEFIGFEAEQLVNEEEPHVLLCFEAEEFVAAVQRDGLSSIFTTLQRSCPGHRPHLLVHRLDHYLSKREREDYARTMGTAGANAQAFNRRIIDNFISKMAIEAPQVGFRDVSTPEEGAGHVCSITRAIAKRHTEKSDAAKYLLGNARSTNKGNAALASLLVAHPINNPEVKTFLSTLCALPSVGPQVAHAMATQYGSLGNLMEMIFDPMRSMTEKLREIEFLQRPGNGTGSGRVTKVGPKAAKQLIDLLTAENPDSLVHEDG